MKKFAFLFVSALFAFTIAACEAPEEKGPAETAGEAVDKATKDVGEAVEEAGEDMQDKANGH